MSYNENVYIKNDGSTIASGSQIHLEYENLTKALTSGQALDLYDVVNLHQGVYLLCVYVRLSCIGVEGFTDTVTNMQLSYSNNTNVKINPTASLGIPTALTINQVAKLHFKDVLTITNDTNTLSIGLLPTFTRENEIELTDVIINFLKLV